MKTIYLTLVFLFALLLFQLTACQLLSTALPAMVEASTASVPPEGVSPLRTPTPTEDAIIVPTKSPSGSNGARHHYFLPFVSIFSAEEYVTASFKFYFPAVFNGDEPKSVAILTPGPTEATQPNNYLPWVGKNQGGEHAAAPGELYFPAVFNGDEPKGGFHRTPVPTLTPATTPTPR